MREFKDFDNKNEYTNSSLEFYEDELFSLIGVLDQITEEELEDKYGITIKEYVNPTHETIIKVQNKLKNNT